MSRTLSFKFRVNEEERNLLALIAKQLKRSQGDTLRFLIKAAVAGLEISSKESIQLADKEKDVNNA